MMFSRKRKEMNVDDGESLVVKHLREDLADIKRRVSDLEQASYLSHNKYTFAGEPVITAGAMFSGRSYRDIGMHCTRIVLSDVVLAIAEHVGLEIALKPAERERVLVTPKEKPRK